MSFLTSLRVVRNSEPSVEQLPARWVLWFSIGLFVGNVLLVALRVDYYDKMGYQPEMHPGIAFIFVPILFLPHLLVSLLIEYLARQFWSKTQNWFHSFLMGGCYATLLFWWAFPDHAFLMIVFNPIVLRWAIGVLFAKWSVGKANKEVARPGAHNAGET